MKEESEKVGLKLNIQKTKIMASGPITSWQIDGETMEKVTDFICHEVMGLDAMIFIFWMLNFKPAFALSLEGQKWPQKATL